MKDALTWVGRSQEKSEIITPYPANALAATLDRDDPPYDNESALPDLWHWLYFASIYKLSEMGRDGHEALGSFLPPIPLPRRMWAGGRLEFNRPIRIGRTIRKQSSIQKITPKVGRSGNLAFVTVEHRLLEGDALLVREEHDIVYREEQIANQNKVNSAEMVSQESLFRRTITPNPVLLFRYSALTFNGHRIHYDSPYCKDVEGYEDLVVHGPLQAILLFDLLRREHPDCAIKQFSFKALNTVFVNHPFSVHANLSTDQNGYDLWVRRHDGVLAMSGTATLKD